MSQVVQCPHCGSDTTKHGRSDGGKQKYRCPRFPRQFVQNPAHVIDDKTRRVVTAFLIEGVKPSIIARPILEVSLRWIYEPKKRLNL